MSLISSTFSKTSLQLFFNMARSTGKDWDQKTLCCFSGHGLRQARTIGAIWKGTDVCWRCPGLVSLDL